MPGKAKRLLRFLWGYRIYIFLLGGLALLIYRYPKNFKKNWSLYLSVLLFVFAAVSAGVFSMCFAKEDPWRRRGRRGLRGKSLECQPGGCASQWGTHFELLNNSNCERLKYEREHFGEVCQTFNNQNYGDELKGLLEEAKKAEAKKLEEMRNAERERVQAAIKNDLESGMMTTRIYQKHNPRIFVVDFGHECCIDSPLTADREPWNGNQWRRLSAQVTAILRIASKYDEVVVRLVSSGGSMRQFGLGAAHLQRLRKAGIPLTVCIDRVAASGGYKLAAMADKIIAAPFAQVGSIGVVKELFNFEEFNSFFGVKFVELTSGSHKRMCTESSKITDEKIEMELEILKEYHEMFKNCIMEHRPKLREHIEELATAKVWAGKRALELGLIDEIMTSDEYLHSKWISHAIIRIGVEKRSWRERAYRNTLKDQISRALDDLLPSWLRGMIRENFINVMKAVESHSRRNVEAKEE